MEAICGGDTDGHADHPISECQDMHPTLRNEAHSKNCVASESSSLPRHTEERAEPIQEEAIEYECPVCGVRRKGTEQSANYHVISCLSLQEKDSLTIRSSQTGSQYSQSNCRTGNKRKAGQLGMDSFFTQKTHK
mmetsp:Transcript_31518/g.32071  ORF Transcript_31518/g.32071 Transcript_31518/m.32071 type:complete len:134 (-) Transcript_31518:35-436(-)